MPTMKDEINPHFHSIPEAKVIPQELNFKLDFGEDQGLMEGGKGVTRSPMIHCCAQCGTTQTPQWRNGPRGPRTLCNACGIRLHRRLNKLKLGTTQRRRKKSTKGVFKTPSSARQHYLRTKTAPSGVSRPRSQRLRSRRMHEMGSNLTRVRSFRCEDFTAAIDLLSLSKEGYKTIGQRLEKLPNRYESLKREIGVNEGDLMGPLGTEKWHGISGEESLRQLRFHEACSKFEQFISQQLESTTSTTPMQ